MGKDINNGNYTIDAVEGVDCIVWNYNSSDTPLSNKQKRDRRKIKDTTWLQHLNTPMLDLKRDGEKLVYCDLLICSKDIRKWESVICKHFKGYNRLLIMRFQVDTEFSLVKQMVAQSLQVLFTIRLRKL